MAALTASVASAQTAPAEPTSAPALNLPPQPSAGPADAASATVKAGKDGFALASADSEFALKLRGYAQADARLFFDDVEEPPPHTFLLRRVRPIVEGTLYKHFGFRVMPDFGGGQATIQDAHLDVRAMPELSFRFGKFKAPFGLERLQSATNLLFVERAFPTLLAPNRDIGAQVYGEVGKGVVSYAVGVFNGVPDGGSTDADTDRHKDWVARVFAHPLRPLDHAAGRDFGIGVAASLGSVDGTAAAPALPQYRTPGQQSFFRYLAVDGSASETVHADGRRDRVSPQLYYYFGPFGVLAEYVLSLQRVRVGGARRTLAHQAWHATATFVLGGDVSYEGVKPHTAIGDGGTGAFELVARYQGLRLDPKTFPIYANDERSARSARAFGVGVGWWANRGVRFMADFESSSFNGGASAGADRPGERVVLLRSQVNW